jgi:quinohemoprotein amine dehydrogenase
MRAPKLEGRWALSGYQAGLGPVYGEVTIEPAPNASDQFRTRARYVYARSGKTVNRDGKAIVYTGHQWRGRSGTGDDALREVMLLDRGMREMTGRWFNGAYNETGMDVTLKRVGRDPVITGLSERGLRAGRRSEVTIYGANLPVPLSAGAVDMGRGVSVARVLQSGADRAVVELDVAADAPVGVRDVFLAGASAAGGVTVYDRIDGIKVRPQSGMARNGGIRFPKQHQQFEAFAFHNGPDGKPDTKDDIEIGPVKVAWSMEEFAATFDDDDIRYVGTLDGNGLFTPNVDGPNAERRNGTNNFGDVWVVATYTPPAGVKETKPLRARAHLLVTVPLYMRFDQPGVAP